VSQSEKAEKFDALHTGSGAFVVANVFDAGSARIVSGLGFKAMATSSGGFAGTIGRRDGLISRDEAIEHARVVVDATDLPVSADLENGFGDAPEAVAESVRRAAESGLVGCTIEDATKDKAQPIYSFDSAVAAMNALDFDFKLTGRCENYLCGNPDLEDTIRRLQAY
jgi:2-methylisocitrate lyase-like PEP mutase family enzyme